MNAFMLGVGVLILYFFAYRFYHRYVAKHIFKISSQQPTPAHTHYDGVDYVPTKKSVLWGHHFSSIAGAAPIVGPAIAVIWGWLPALLWVVFGSIFIGAVHDGGTLILSAKRQGRTIADITGGLINGRTRVIFLIIILFLTWTVVAVFSLVIAILFTKYPEVVIPINAEIIFALLIGWWGYKLKKNLLIVSILAVILMYALIFVGIEYPISLSPWLGIHSLAEWAQSMGIPSWAGSPLMLWILFLLLYSFIASVLPVWTLLQPRDYINSHQLFVGLAAMYLGFFLAAPQIVAPVIQIHPEGAPSMLPFLFIMIACGAISGFHGLVSSGTTSKQLDSMDDACSIGCGSMLGEGTLAVMSIFACTAGFASQGQWFEHYASWQSAGGLDATMGAFILGTGNFLAALGLPENFAQAMIAVLIISFAATSLDTATRIQRLIIGELGETIPQKTVKNIFQNRYWGSLIAVGSAFLLIVSTKEGRGGMTLWPLFGTTNQLIATLALFTITFWLMKKKINIAYTAIPLLFLTTILMWAIIEKILEYHAANNYLLLISQSFIFVLALWFIVEWWIKAKRLRKSVIE